VKFLNNELFIIAEAGVNHNGDPKKAYELIEFASKAKANAIKFQTFDANKVCTQNAPKAEYQSSLTKNNTQVEMLKALELRKNTFKELSKHANDIGILFMCTANSVNKVQLPVSFSRVYLRFLCSYNLKSCFIFK
jgi:N,N'-diacetyllegionaminate synthase